jgi:hypothetical protein
MNWKNIKDRKPHAYQIGHWDGKKSDEVLVCTRSGEFHVAVMYHVIMDGSESFDFYDSRDFDIQNVEYWTEIDRPL